MVKRKTKKLNTAALVAAAIALVGLVLVIVGLVIDWVSLTISVPLVGDSTITATLADCGGEYAAEGFDAMNTFAIITVVATALCFLASAATLVLKNKMVKLVAVILAAVTIVCAIITIICTFSYCGDEGVFASAAPAIGAWLLTVGGVIGGLACAYAALKT